MMPLTQDNEILLGLIACNSYRVAKLESVVLAWFLQGPQNHIMTRDHNLESVTSSYVAPFLLCADEKSTDMFFAGQSSLSVC